MLFLAMTLILNFEFWKPYVSIYSSRVTQTKHPVQQYLPKNKQVIAEAVFWQGFRRDENRSILGVCEDFHHKSNADKRPVQQYLPKTKQVIAEAVFCQGFRRDENRSIPSVCEDFHHKSNADRTPRSTIPTQEQASDCRGSILARLSQGWKPQHTWRMWGFSSQE